MQTAKLYNIFDVEGTKKEITSVLNRIKIHVKKFIEENKDGDLTNFSLYISDKRISGTDYCGDLELVISIDSKKCLDGVPIGYAFKKLYPIRKVWEFEENLPNIDIFNLLDDMKDDIVEQLLEYKNLNLPYTDSYFMEIIRIIYKYWKY